MTRLALVAALAFPLSARAVPPREELKAVVAQIQAKPSDVVLREKANKVGKICAHRPESPPIS